MERFAPQEGLRLSVLKGSEAEGFYGRLGFECVREDEWQLHLRRAGAKPGLRMR